MSRVVLVTGIQAAGKTTVGRLLAERLPGPAVAFDGDVLYEMVVNGGFDMTPDPAPEAVRQLHLRYRGSAMLAQHYTDNGFDFVCSDIVMGADIDRWMEWISAERYLVVLAPSVEAVVRREVARGSNAYRDWRSEQGDLTEAVARFQLDLDATPRRGLWLDTSDEAPAQTVDRILAGDLRAARY